MIHVGKNVVIVLALVAAGFFVAWLRFRPYLGSEGRYTDGVRTYDVSDAGEVRYAVWDRPEELGGDVNSAENERRPALSPDGLLMIFVVGQRGLGADLYVAQMEEGVARDPRPLDILNSVADEWSPSFGPGGLYFSSDRPGTAGGLDLWRAPYALGVFGEPERLQGGINSSADDSDPAAIPGSDAIVFASNRGHQRLFDFDLYVARPRAQGPAEEAGSAAGDSAAGNPDTADPSGAGEGAWEVESLVVLNSRFDEREPAFTADGRNLFFASDRTGGYGDFDLYRSALGAQGWVAPEVLASVNTEGAERDPLPSRDGFELLFTARESEPRPHSDVRRARSRELFRTPGRPVGWKDLLVLGILLLLAILAWLAKQWDQLEVLYKCVLISLVIHLLMMWWFRDVYPEGTEYELRGGESDRIRVRLVSNPNGAAQANAERGGELEVARAESEPEGAERRELETAEAASAAAPAPARLERASAEAVDSPARDTAQTPERASAPSAEAPAVRQAEPDFERMADGARAMTVQEPDRAAPAERSESDARQAALDSVQDTARVASQQAPRTWTQERVAAGAALPDAPAARSVQHVPERARESPADAARVALPRESIERRTQGAPELVLQAGPVTAYVERATPEAARDGELGESLPDALSAADASGAAPVRLERASAEAVASPARDTTQTPQRASAPSAEALAVRQAEPDFERMADGVRAMTVPEPGRAAPAERSESDARQAALESVPDAVQAASQPAPRTRVQERAVAGAGLPDAPVARSVEHAPQRPAESPADAARVALPQESVERRAQGAPELVLQAGPVTARAERDTPDVERDGELVKDVPDALRTAAARAAERPALEVDGRSDPTADVAARATARFEPTEVERSQLALAQVGEETFERLQEDRRADESLLADAPAERARPDTARDTQTEAARADNVAPERSDALELAPRRFEALERSTLRDTPAPTPFRAAQATPEARSPSRDVALSKVVEDVQPLRGEDDSERSEDLESGIERELSESLLALESSASAREEHELGPRRFERSAPRELDTPAPSFRPLGTGERTEEETGAVAARWEHTAYQSRSGEQKARAIVLHGGSEATEAAVAAGLRYLASRQRAEGNFGRLRDRHEKYHYVTVGKTGLVLLAFMGAGHTQDSETEHSAVVTRAIAFLLAMQDEDSGHFGYTSSYSHAIATYALAECYALTGDKRLRAPIERAVAHILENQVQSSDARFNGGWGYYFPDGKTLDPWPRASVTAWQVMALESARLGGLSVPDRAFVGAHDFLVRCWDAERRAFRYSHDPDRLTGDYPVLPGSTPAAMFALSLMGEDIAGGSFRPGRSFLLDRTPRVYQYTSDDDFVFRGVGNLYFWYYSTLALFRVGGRAWDAWNEGMKGALLPAQEENGSWNPISIYALDYAYDRDGDRVYTTAMCVLTLEVYYRYFTPLLKVD